MYIINVKEDISKRIHVINQMNTLIKRDFRGFLLINIIDYIKSTGLNYYVGPCETSIEGDYDTLMEIVKNCQYVAAKAGCKSMNTYVKISYKPEGDVLTIEKKVTKHHK